MRERMSPLVARLLCSRALRIDARCTEAQVPGDGLGKCGNCTDLICLRCIYAASIYADPSERAVRTPRARAQGARDLEIFSYNSSGTQKIIGKLWDLP